MIFATTFEYEHFCCCCDWVFVCVIYLYMFYLLLRSEFTKSGFKSTGDCDCQDLQCV